MKNSIDLRVGILFAPLALCLQSCFLFASDDDDDYTPPAFVDSVEYAEPNAAYLMTVPIADNEIVANTLVPAGATHSVDPPLPAGLELDPATGTISGTPTAASAMQAYFVSIMSAGTEVAMATVFITVLAPAPPSDLTYSENPARYVVDSTITANRPMFIGAIDDFTVSPALPAGLSLDATSGFITGRPTLVQQAAMYTITGSNPFGTTTVDVSIEIEPRQTPHVLFVTDSSEPIVSTYVADAFPGNLYQRGYETVAVGATHVAASRDGTLVYVLELNGDIRRYMPQPKSARPLDGAVVANVPGALKLAVDATGTRLIVLAAGSISAFDLDLAGTPSGQISAFVPAGASDLLTPSFEPFAYVSCGFAGGVKVYSLEGGLAALPGTAPLAGFADFLSAPESGDYLYVAETNASAVHAFRVDTSAAAADQHLVPAGAPQAVPGLLSDIAATPDGRKVFASTGFDGDVVFFHADVQTGALSFGASMAVGSYITELAVDPGSDLLYALDIVAREIHLYRIGTLELSFSDRSRTRQAPETMALARGPGIFNLTDHVFVANETESTVDVFALDRSAETLQAGTQVTGLASPTTPTFNAPRDVLYVPESAGGRIAQFSLNTAGPSLAPLVPASVAAGEAPTHIALGARERFAYVVDSAGALLTFAVNQGDGTLTDTGSFVALGPDAGPIAVESTGQFLYVLEAGTSQVAAFTLDRITGAPTLLGRFATPATPTDLVAFPQGRALFVSSSAFDTVTSLSIDAFDGSLAVQGASAATGAMPSAIDIMTQGFNIYTGNPGDSTMTILDVDFATGFATPFPAGVSPVATPPGLTDLALDSGDLYLFATFSNATSQLVLFKSQPTNTVLQIGSVPIAAGAHHLEVDFVD